ANEYVEDIFKFPTQGSAYYAFINAYNSWGADDFEKIARKYQVSHAVVENNKRLIFKEEYKNEYFRVYNLSKKVFKKIQTKVDLPNGSFEKLDENGFPLHWNHTGKLHSTNLSSL
ncbi:unnamed protein product, partial [marine sediment metagenome]